MDKIKEVAFLFFKLGLIAFGGPAAHIAMMEDEVVTKRKWMTREHFLDLIGATNLIPGPNSTEMAIHCGFHRAGWAGLIVSGVCFIFPAVVLTGALAHVYVTYGDLPNIEPFFYGIRPAVLAVILGAVIKLGKKAVKGKLLAVIGMAVAAASLAGVSEVVAILTGAVVGMFCMNGVRGFKGSPAVLPFSFKQIVIPAVALPTAVTLSLSQLFMSFLKIGCILFGSGYVLIAYLEGEFVHRLGWLTEAQLLDAVAIGQFTPGPVLSTSTFIGYQIQGVEGALLATLGIFMPSFVFVALLNPLIPRLRKSTWASAFLDSANVSAVGIMAAVTIQLGIMSVSEWKSALIAGISILTVLTVKKISAVWIVLGGSLLGYLFSFIPG